MFFECRFSRPIWECVLKWLKTDHMPSIWDEEIEWIIARTKGNRVRSKILKTVVAETVYYIWNAGNKKIHGDRQHQMGSWENICELLLLGVLETLM